MDIVRVTVTVTVKVTVMVTVNVTVMVTVTVRAAHMKLRSAPPLNSAVLDLKLLLFTLRNAKRHRHECLLEFRSQLKIGS